MSAGMDGGAFTGLTVAGLAATLAIGLVIWPAAKTRQSAEQASSTAPRAPLPDTTRILDILSSQPGPSAQDRQAASALNEAGDRAYRRHDHVAAWRAYSNAYPNAPSAHAYVMSGDSHWRDVLSVQRAQRSAAKACPLDNRYFARDLALDVAQHHEVGLALAARSGDRRLLNSAWYRRADQSAACLRVLANDHRARPASDCVDLERLDACLGPPLPLP